MPLLDTIQDTFQRVVPRKDAAILSKPPHLARMEGRRARRWLPPAE